MDPDYPQITTLHAHSLRMTPLAGQPAWGGSLRKKVAANLGLKRGWGMSSHIERNELVLWSAPGTRRPLGHQGRQRPQAGWREVETEAAALVEERAGWGAAPGVGVSLTGAAGAGGRWKW